MILSVRFVLIVTSLFMAVACVNFIKVIEGDEYNAKIDLVSGSDHFSILFSHNINGETHPCGCRHFPLGGLEQVAGLMHELKDKKSFLYVDTGDTFFQSNSLSKFQEKSKKYTALKLRDALNDLGLRYFVPGDQDFAAGIPFFNELMKDAKFEVIVSNIVDQAPIKIKKFAVLEVTDQKIFIIGLIKPRLYKAEVSKWLTPIEDGFKSALAEISANGFSADNPNHKIVVLSHSGMGADEKLAKKYPIINWIIGAHTQNFHKNPDYVGETGITQVLSRNHYMGEVKFALSGKNISYTTHEIRDGLKDKVEKNPYTVFLQSLKSEVKKIQLKEEQQFSFSDGGPSRIPTSQSCIGCHEAQTEKWKSTAHSIAYITLMQTNEEAKPECIECHSVGYKDMGGFDKTTNMLVSENKKFDIKNYWNAFQKLNPPKGSIREMRGTKRVVFANKWLAHDDRFKITHNYANVQCLNCHDQKAEHPFDDSESKPQLSEVAKGENMKNKCLNCHTPDQSPAWYENTRPKEQFITKQIEKVACPK